MDEAGRAGPGRREGITVYARQAGAAEPPGRFRAALARLVVRAADGLTRMLGARPSAGREEITEAELRDLVAVNTVLDHEERRLIDDVLDAARRHLREVMVPRTEVLFLDSGLTVSRAVRLVRHAAHSRYPVIDGSHDDVIGFVHLRDLLIRPDGDRTVTVGQLAREIERWPGSKKALAALSEMRRDGRHMAVVVDEYGGTAGIVTLEDLIEELVGEIRDEYDASGPVEVDGTVPAEVDGLLNLPDLADRSGLVLPNGPYETVGGYLMAALGKLPAVGDAVSVDGWRLTVAALDGRRVQRVALSPPRSRGAALPVIATGRLTPAT